MFYADTWQNMPQEKTITVYNNYTSYCIAKRQIVYSSTKNKKDSNEIKYESQENMSNLTSKVEEDEMYIDSIIILTFSGFVWY